MQDLVVDDDLDPRRAEVDVLADGLKLGRRCWKKASGYQCVRRGRRTRSFDTSRSSEMVFAPKSPAGQLSEAILGCQILNRMTDFGRPTSYGIDR